MKRSLTLALAAAVALALTAGCKNQTPKKTEQSQPAAAQAPAKAATAQAPAKTAAAQGESGKVVQTMDAGGYTYVQVDTGKKKVWAAAPKFKVKVGDSVVIPNGMLMKNFHSKTLNRDFPEVYFVGSILVGGTNQTINKQPEMPANHPPQKADAKVDLKGIKKAKGGETVAEIFQNKKALAGKTVVIRAKVVKYNPQIMGKNWIHLEDGTGKAGSNDLTVTTSTKAKVGDTVLVTGVVTTNKDFGYGYKYDVILENAKVKVE